MDSPGVTVRPIPQIDGETGFAEIFFDNVVVPEDQVLGEVGAGWSVAMATAGSERGLSLRSPARYTEAADRLVQLYASRGGPTASADAVAQAHMDAEAYKLHTYWTASRVARGHAVGPEASCNKIFWSETDVAIHATALDLLGPDAELLDAGRPVSGSTATCSRSPAPFTPGPTRFSATWSPSACSGCPGAESWTSPSPTNRTPCARRAHRPRHRVHP